jgi:hypothetical protein
MWVAFLTRHDLLNKDHLPSALDSPVLKKALNVLDVMNFETEEREAYEDHLKWLRIEANTLKKYEAKGFMEGEAKGFIEGEIKGKAELLLFLLQHKFKSVPVHYQQKIEQASPEYLGKCAERVLEFSTIEDIFEDT